MPDSAWSFQCKQGAWRCSISCLACKANRPHTRPFVKTNQPRLSGADRLLLAIRVPLAGRLGYFFLATAFLAGAAAFLAGAAAFFRCSSLLGRSGLGRSSSFFSRSSSLLCRGSSLLGRSGLFGGGCLFGGSVFHRVILPNIKKSRSPKRSQRVPYINLFAIQVKEKVNHNMRQTTSGKGVERKKRRCAKMFNEVRCIRSQ